jgi:octaprenyl-diphosphate synthase
MMVATGLVRVLEILSGRDQRDRRGRGHAADARRRRDARRGRLRRGDPAQDREAVRGRGAARRRARRSDRAREDAFARYGMHLGSAFQIMDDVLDYTGEPDAIGKNLGDDLAEGKMTLPLIRALAWAATPTAR